MVGKLIVRGIILGILAGLLAFAFAKVFGEPLVNTAIGIESANEAAEQAAQVAQGLPAAPEEPEMFSRSIQSGVGLLTGIVGIGAGIGGLFAVLFAFANGRVGRLGPKPTAALIALLCVVTVYVVPALKYPANPPSVGHEDTIALRTGLYFLTIAISLAATLGALALRHSLRARFSAWDASWLAAAAYVVVIAIAFLVLPTINEVPKTFPAVTLWQFRVTSLGIQTVLWGSLGLLMGYFNGLPSQR
jgi:hypothetical protein